VKHLSRMSCVLANKPHMLRSANTSDLDSRHSSSTQVTVLPVTTVSCNTLRCFNHAVASGKYTPSVVLHCVSFPELAFAATSCCPLMGRLNFRLLLDSHVPVSSCLNCTCSVQ